MYFDNIDLQKKKCITSGNIVTKHEYIHSSSKGLFIILYRNSVHIYTEDDRKDILKRPVGLISAFTNEKNESAALIPGLSNVQDG